MSSDVAVDYFQILSEGLVEKTLRQADEALANAEKNQPFIEKTIRALAGREAGKRCLVVSGGPSLMRRQSLAAFKPVADRLVVVAADGALGHCLRAGIVPRYVLSVDPHGTRVVRWFGDDDLGADKLADDYFRRQDLDEHFNVDEIRKNQEQLGLVNAAGRSIKAVLSTSASEAVRRRCFAAGMDVYWWNPILDDYTEAGSLTRRLHRRNRVPCMNAGGNVGTAAVVFAAKVLGAETAILVGMDFSYYADLPIEKSQYYSQLERFIPRADLPRAFKTIRNPHLGQDFYTDPAYHWYREGLLALVRGIEGCTIVNATEGGILFGDGIVWRSAAEVVDLMRKGDG